VFISSVFFSMFWIYFAISLVSLIVALWVTISYSTSLPTDSFTLIIVGPSQSGKSTIVNEICEKIEQTPTGFYGVGRGCTNDINIYHCTNHNIGTVTIIDVIGFGDGCNIVTDDEIIFYIKSRLLLGSIKTFDAILITEPIFDNTQKLRDTLDKTEKIFGQQVWDVSIVLMTKGNMMAMDEDQKLFHSSRVEEIHKFCEDRSMKCLEFPTNYMKRYRDKSKSLQYKSIVSKSQWTQQLQYLFSLIKEFKHRKHNLSVPHFFTIMINRAEELRKQYIPIESCPDNTKKVMGTVLASATSFILHSVLGASLGMFAPVVFVGGAVVGHYMTRCTIEEIHSIDSFYAQAVEIFYSDLSNISDKITKIHCTYP